MYQSYRGRGLGGFSAAVTSVEKRRASDEESGAVAGPGGATAAQHSTSRLASARPALLSSLQPRTLLAAIYYSLTDRHTLRDRERERREVLGGGRDAVLLLCACVRVRQQGYVGRGDEDGTGQRKVQGIPTPLQKRNGRGFAAWRCSAAATVPRVPPPIQKLSTV